MIESAVWPDFEYSTAIPPGTVSLEAFSPFPSNTTATVQSVESCKPVRIFTILSRAEAEFLAWTNASSGQEKSALCPSTIRILLLIGVPYPFMLIIPVRWGNVACRLDFDSGTGNGVRLLPC